jgi:DNA-binding FrmR family transcriptional regulator
MTVLAASGPDAPVQERLRRIEGQAHGLVRMFESGRPALEVLEQIAALRAALGGLGLAIISREAAVRGMDAERSPECATSEAQVEALLALVHRLVRCT